MGLLVSLLSGLFYSMIGWGMDMTAKQIVFLTLVAIAKDGFLYLKQHPVDKVSWETTRLTRDEAAGTTTEQSSKTVITSDKPETTRETP